jgi:hypothetical protein
MTLTKQQLTHYLQLRRTAPSADAERLHAGLRLGAPAFHTSQLSDPAVHVDHKRRILRAFLESDSPVGPVLERLWALRSDAALAIVAVLRDERRNGRRVRTFGLRFLLGHPSLNELAATRRRGLVRLFKHFLGERTWSAVRRALGGLRSFDRTGDRFLQRELLRHAPRHTTDRRMWEALCVLAGVECALTDPHLVLRARARVNLANGAGLPRETLLGLRGQFPTVSVARALELAAPEPEPRGDGPLTTLHKRALTGEPVDTEELEGWLDAVERTTVPVRGAAAVVVDLSASMASSGARAFHPAALGVTLARLLSARAIPVTVHTVGGTGSVEGPGFPRPRWSADLASGVLDAAATEPGAIFVITDGYENRREGDVAEVVRGLRQLELGIAVTQVIPLFSGAEDLSARRLGDGIPVLAVEHEDEVVELAALAVAASASDPVWPRTLEALQSLLVPE